MHTGPNRRIIESMRARNKSLLIALLALCSGLSACLGSGESSTERQKNADTVAGKMGKMAHSLAQQSSKATAAAGRGLAQAAREAHDGWRQASQEEKKKQSAGK
jgi:hypothetical protein